MKEWITRGDPVVLAARHKKYLIGQEYSNPYTNKEVDWTLFHSDTKWACIVFALTDDRNVIVIEEFKFGSNRVALELPCGGCDEQDANPEDTVRRELREETGYRADVVISLVPDSGVWIDTASSDAIYYPFLAWGCRVQCSQSLDPTEYIDVKKIPFLEWLQMVGQGKVPDAKSIVTTHMAEWYLRQFCEEIV